VTNVSAKNAPYYTRLIPLGFLACCQFSDSVEWIVDSYTITGWLLELDMVKIAPLVYPDVYLILNTFELQKCSLWHRHLACEF